MFVMPSAGISVGVKFHSWDAMTMQDVISNDRRFLRDSVDIPNSGNFSNGIPGNKKGSVISVKGNCSLIEDTRS